MADHREVVVRRWRTGPDGLLCEEMVAAAPEPDGLVSDALVAPVLSMITSGRSVVVEEFMDEAAARAKFGERWRELAAKGGRVRWRLAGDGDWRLVHDPR